MEYEKVSQKFTNPKNGKEKKVWGSEKTLGSAKACGLWQFYEGKIWNFFLETRARMAMRTAMPGCLIFCLIWHGHAHSHAWLHVFLSDLAWPCVRMNFLNTKHTTSCVGAYVGAQNDHTSNTHQIKSSSHVNHLISS